MHLGDEQLRILEICQRLGYPVKNVERSFRRTYGMSPKRYLSLQRLTVLRQRLRSKAVLRSRLTDLYFDCGLTHSGRTAGEYRALFGELPSETTARSG
ncbi:helix-turn-helix domain-containing protein [Sedimentitalea arenosa]|uniref:AraC family transcriptional regulator n=1 Tax=Sedimentitalea arenosa TaxID=2798803 RepID=A0A8J7LXD3_9RHOB|nr:AraC family transcriptional regulator [Arenibacterium arenosum]